MKNQLVLLIGTIVLGLVSVNILAADSISDDISILVHSTSQKKAIVRSIQSDVLSFLICEYDSELNIDTDCKPMRDLDIPISSKANLDQFENYFYRYTKKKIEGEMLNSPYLERVSGLSSGALIANTIFIFDRIILRSRVHFGMSRFGKAIRWGFYPLIIIGGGYLGYKSANKKAQKKLSLENILENNSSLDDMELEDASRAIFDILEESLVSSLDSLSVVVNPMTGEETLSFSVKEVVQFSN